MTPKLASEISAKLQQIWGPYAGWVQTVMFTADLPAFAASSASTLLKDGKSEGDVGEVMTAKLNNTPQIQLPTKRKRKQASTEAHKLSSSPQRRKLTTAVTQDRLQEVLAATSSMTRTSMNLESVKETTIATTNMAIITETSGTTLAERIKTRKRSQPKSSSSRGA